MRRKKSRERKRQVQSKLAMLHKGERVSTESIRKSGKVMNANMAELFIIHRMTMECFDNEYAKRARAV
jgi:hypothetical protein